MHDIDSEARQALVASAERIVRERYAWSAAAAPRRAGDAASSQQWREFAELGWLATGIAEQDGGLGLPLSLTSVLIEATAPAAMPEPLASQLALVGHLLNGCPAGPTRDALLADWQAGHGYGALALPAVPYLAHAPAAALHCTQVAGDWRLDGRVAGVLDLGFAGHVMVAATGADAGLALFALDTSAAGLSIEDHAVFDGRRIADLELRAVVAAPAALIARGDQVARVLAECGGLFHLLLASETLGLTRALTRITFDYLGQRQQFGRKLAEFQALQHRVVDLHLANVRLESTLELARAKVDSAGLPAAAGYVAAALAQACVVGRHVGEEAIQLHGGIGMTDELVVARYVRRLTANELLAGGHAAQFTASAQARGITLAS